MLINWLLNNVIKLVACSDLNDTEKISFFNLERSQVIKSVFKFFWYRFHTLIDLGLNECFP